MTGDMVPCLFGTLTSQRYHWDEVIRIIAEVEGIDDHKSLSKGKRRELVNKYPLFVSWYCALRLELTLKTIVVPTFGASAFFAVFEWSPTGAMVHVHYVLWKPGAPRFDLRAEKLQERAKSLRKAGLVATGSVSCKVEDVVDFFFPNMFRSGIPIKMMLERRRRVQLLRESTNPMNTLHH